MTHCCCWQAIHRVTEDDISKFKLTRVSSSWSGAENAVPNIAALSITTSSSKGQHSGNADDCSNRSCQLSKAVDLATGAKKGGCHGRQEVRGMASRVPIPTMSISVEDTGGECCVLVSSGGWAPLALSCSLHSAQQLLGGRAHCMAQQDSMPTVAHSAQAI